MAGDETQDSKNGIPKYQVILIELRRAIAAREYKQGDRLPSETDLGATFGVSRLTVQRALKELQIEGLVERRAGSGTYVKAVVSKSAGHLFGLLIPGLGETEIFEPICQGMAKAGGRGGHALLWGDNARPGDGSPAERADQARQLCADYVSRHVSGVFFAPIEGIRNKDEVNRDISGMLDAAGIPVVLLDRCIEPYPARSKYDLVGIDNRRAGDRMTRHLLARGAKSPVFWGRAHSAPTVDARAAGFLDVLRSTGHNGSGNARVVFGDPSDAHLVSQTIHALAPDAFLCANDVTAAHLMQSLESLGVDVPTQMRIAGIDDVRYSNLLRVPLTTLQQPCLEIGEVAIQVMLTRIAQPGLPARDVLLDSRLIVRDSCGR